MYRILCGSFICGCRVEVNLDHPDYNPVEPASCPRHGRQALLGATVTITSEHWPIYDPPVPRWMRLGS